MLLPPPPRQSFVSSSAAGEFSVCRPFLSPSPFLYVFISLEGIKVVSRSLFSSLLPSLLLESKTNRGEGRRRRGKMRRRRKQQRDEICGALMETPPPLPRAKKEERRAVFASRFEENSGGKRLKADAKSGIIRPPFLLLLLLFLLGIESTVMNFDGGSGGHFPLFSFSGPGESRGLLLLLRLRKRFKTLEEKEERVGESQYRVSPSLLRRQLLPTYKRL